ncbi:MAG: hypothetical protein KIT84_03770 [Labilithrix sp.]|nr:hypothetical protein [Labilithrix sp.]MCW5810102.1 hypothetical protein [Labilithrix sp.]
MKRALSALLLGGLVACGNDFIEGWRVDRPRVLGARVEGAEVSWLVARTTRVEWAWAVCADTKLDAPRCDTPVLGAGNGATAGDVVTMDLGAAAAPERLLLAAFCAEGIATLSPADFTASCAGGGAPLLASVKIGAPQPQPAPPVLLLDGEAPGGCVAPGSPHALGFTFRAEDRDPGETLLASTTVTDGELDRQYTALEPHEAAPRDVTIAWTAPAAAGTATAYLVLRDGRGGAAFTRITVCVR